MSAIKKLAQQTALYGLPSILGRVLNFILVPIHTGIMNQSQFGSITDLYSLVAVGIVLLTYGFETAYFNNSQNPLSEKKSFATGMQSLLFTSLLFLLAFEWGLPELSSVLRYENQPHYLRWMVWIMLLDVLSALPFARLRFRQKALEFVGIKFILIGLNIGFNLFFFLGLKHWPELKNSLPAAWNDPVAWVLISNLLASAVMFLLLLPQWRQADGWRFDRELWRKMMGYGLPLMAAGLAGIANELADRQLLKYLLPEHLAMNQLGVYGAVYKLSIFLMLFVQAYRYAAEPFFFQLRNAKNSGETNAQVLEGFVMFLGLVLLGLNASLPIIKHFINERFWEGLALAPILFAANYILGINTHLGIWYKLANKTRFAWYITGLGLFFTLWLNFWLIPVLGIEGAAWATLTSYTAMMLMNLIMGHKHYPLPYAYKRLTLYFLSSVILGFFAWKLQSMVGLWACMALVPYLILLAFIKPEFAHKLWPKRQA